MNPSLAFHFKPSAVNTARDPTLVISVCASILSTYLLPALKRATFCPTYHLFIFKIHISHHWSNEQAQLDREQQHHHCCRQVLQKYYPHHLECTLRMLQYAWRRRVPNLIRSVRQLPPTTSANGPDIPSRRSYQTQLYRRF